jgi:DNA-binding LacI/PurR family transcriptional regulator
MTQDNSSHGQRPRRPTAHDVAQLARVSRSAVSRCFLSGNSLSDEKRKVILRAAAKLGYEPNVFASSLNTKRSNLVAVIISNLTNLYYPQVLAELTQRLDAQGIRVLLFALQNEADVGKVLSQLWRYRVDGAIAAARLSVAQLEQFEKHQVPVVLYNLRAENDAVPSVFCDSVGGARVLVDHLVAAGHQRFTILAGPQDSYVENQRVEGALARLGHHRFSAEVLAGRFDHESGAEGLREAMSRDPRPDALISANDVIAIGAIDAAREEFGLTIPDDLSIVGFDGVEPAAWASYRLTTISQPVGRMTAAAVSMLLERIYSPGLPPEVRSFTGSLIAGRSARLRAYPAVRAELQGSD